MTLPLAAQDPERVRSKTPFSEECRGGHFPTLGRALGDHNLQAPPLSLTPSRPHPLLLLSSSCSRPRYHFTGI